MASLFWENLDNVRQKIGIDRQTIEKECNLANNAFTQGKKRGSSPSADLAYQLARTIGLTIEELVDNGAGAEYVRQWAKREGKVYSPPDRIADIVNTLKGLNDHDLNIVRGTINGILGKDAIPEIHTAAEKKDA
jgi:transcriptional regulator with XRE-family HTH domain